MAGGNFFALLDDIASLLDDVAAMTKLAAKKTAGVLGDDLALNAQQTTGVSADRELPVVWAVAMGSLKNKAILVPLALIISALAPVLVLPMLIIGGLYLCYEGVEKLFHKFTHSQNADQAHHATLVSALTDPKVDIVAFEKEKIKTAIRTDFILSAEIVTITLGAVADHPLITQIGVLIGISLLMAVGVYGLVAAIVKLDDLGIALSRKSAKLACGTGAGLLWLAPKLMKFLSVAGTVAMFLVGGGIIVHGWAWLDAIFHHWFANLTSFASLAQMIANAGVGVLAGLLVLTLVLCLKAFQKKIKNNASKISKT